MCVLVVLDVIIKGEKVIEKHLRRNRFAGYFQSTAFAG